MEHLLNTVIDDLNLLSIDELNLAWACILYKGHQKDRFIDSSYRSISICPLLSKAIDTYISDIYSDTWNSHTAETQFQQSSSSHELAALTLTETIQYSLHSISRPLFVIFLDAKSAFDRVLWELLINNLYDCCITDQGLIMINQRLRNRKTVCEWDKTLVGPFKDQCGVEQGGKNSSDFYKIYNNTQLNLAQESTWSTHRASNCVKYRSSR